MINKMLKLAKQFPDAVKILHTNDDGSIVCEIPAGWFKIVPKIKREMTAEEKEKAKLRAADMRKKLPVKSSNNL
jgi:hypothetical protein